MLFIYMISNLIIFNPNKLPLILDEMQNKTKVILPRDYLIIKNHYLDNIKFSNQLYCFFIK